MTVDVIYGHSDLEKAARTLILTLRESRSEEGDIHQLRTSHWNRSPGRLARIRCRPMRVISSAATGHAQQRAAW